MRILRFDPKVSFPVSHFGSHFTVAPLTAPGARAQVQVLHLPAGGAVGRHEAALRQLFAVVAGSGWASGQESRHRDLRAGYAALWDQGEDHEAGTDTGLTALCIEGDFEVWATAVTKDITVTDYNAAWPRWFEQVRAHVWPAVSDIAVGIDHVGSTAVPGLAAKPIIDLDVVVASEAGTGPVIARLTDIGYRWRGDLGVAGRQVFDPVRDLGLPPHHLYLVVKDSRPHLDHWLLRDLLKADGAARQSYAALKRRNAEIAQGDIDVYVAAKAALVAALLARARAERGLPPVEYWEPDAPVK
jgi:GrpB-like predicted nucleotidyltransferase (UPF0157 family)/quercetin dioxygenase-like cupin family protein